MHQEQFEKLQLLSEKLTDVALVEADPENWHGQGLKPNEMTRETRGDRYWCKKNAVATVSLIMRIHALQGQVRAASIGAPPGETPQGGAVTEPASFLDGEIDAAEKEASELVKRLQDPAAREAFVKSASGKA